MRKMTKIYNYVKMRYSDCELYRYEHKVGKYLQTFDVSQDEKYSLFTHYSPWAR